MKRPILLVMGIISCASFAAAQLPGARTAAAAKPKFKAIWERVNYKEDLTLFDVYFVSKDEGWVAGEAGTILHTKDGGNNWTAELGGDPNAQGAQLKHIFFTNPTHGWAQAWNTMFRTTDGENWQQVIGDIRGDAIFVSDVKGFRTYGNGIIFATEDGGSDWKEVFTCRAKMEVEGLTQEKDCDLETLHFPSATVGYLAGDSRITVKTEDGGASWNVLVGPEEPGDQRALDVFFLDEKTGYEVRNSGLFRTIDGGQSWQGVIATLPRGAAKVKFVDREVGWSCLGSTWAYSTDGGKRWTSRQVGFPTGVTAFCLPTRDRGYVVGGHGMIYRYRVVPIEYTSKGMIDAPMMPAASANTGSGN